MVLRTLECIAVLQGGLMKVFCRWPGLVSVEKVAVLNAGDNPSHFHVSFES